METKQTEVKQNGAKKPAPKKGKNPFRSNKFKRGGMATLMTVVFVAIVIVLNVVVSALAERFPSMDIDMTAQGLNTLSDQAIEIAQSIDEDTTIYLIGSEDAYENNQIYSSYGLEYSQVASLARRLAEANSHIKVEFVDPDTNPTFISEYADEDLSTGKVMVQTERRHRVLTVTDLFMVDSALAGALELVNMEDVPVFTIATGHGEMLTSDNMASFISMLEDQNFEVQEIDLLTESIPEGTQVLMLPTPTTDYSEAEVDKLREYLNNTTNPEALTLLATSNPTQGSMPNYEAFLEEWGIRVEEGVVAETNTDRMALADAYGVLVDPSEDYLSGNTYDRLVSYYSAPITKLFDANNGISTYDLWTTSRPRHQQPDRGLCLQQVCAGRRLLCHPQPGDVRLLLRVPGYLYEQRLQRRLLCDRPYPVPHRQRRQQCHRFDRTGADKRDGCYSHPQHHGYVGHHLQRCHPGGHFGLRLGDFPEEEAPVSL